MSKKELAIVRHLNVGWYWVTRKWKNLSFHSKCK